MTRDKRIRILKVEDCEPVEKNWAPPRTTGELAADSPSHAAARRRWRDRARRALANAHLHIAAVRDAPRFWHAAVIPA